MTSAAINAIKRGDEIIAIIFETSVFAGKIVSVESEEKSNIQYRVKGFLYLSIIIPPAIFPIAPPKRTTPIIDVQVYKEDPISPAAILDAVSSITIKLNPEANAVPI